MKRCSSIVSLFRGMKNPDMMFDLICVQNYMCGKGDVSFPIDESRKVFGRIKVLLARRPKCKK